MATQSSHNVRSEFSSMTINEIREKIISQLFPCDICCLNIHGDLNVGSMMRTANLCNVGVVICGRKQYDKRSAVGSQHYTPIDRLQCTVNSDSTLIDKLTVDDFFLDDEKFYEYIQEKNYIPVFIEQHVNSIKLTNDNVKMILKKGLELQKKLLFIFGNESIGIPRNIMSLYNKFDEAYIIELDEMGCLQSFNVSACCAITAYKIMECYKEILNMS
jgi:tRNA G18 (ribose-2'-O)-methylase SpoU